MSFLVLNTLQCLPIILAKDTQGPLRSSPCLCFQQESHFIVVPIPGCNTRSHCLGLLLIGTAHLVLVHAVASAAGFPAFLCLTHRCLGPCAFCMHQLQQYLPQENLQPLTPSWSFVPTTLCTSGTAGLSSSPGSWLLVHASLLCCHLQAQWLLAAT